MLGLFAAGLVGTIAEPCAWAEVRVGETAVATAWPYLPSVVEPRGASGLSAGLLPPNSRSPSQSSAAAPTVSAPEAVWLASLKLPDLPVRIDARVVEYLRFYRDSERGRAIARQWAERRGRFVPAVQAELKRASLPLDLVWLSMVESGHDPSIRSPAGALGLWQFMPGTARLYGLEVDRWIDERHDPELSTLAAVRFLSDLFDRFGSWELAMAAYNMGPGGLDRAIQKYNTNDYWLLSRYEAGVPWETTLYVPKIIATALVMNNQRAFGLGDVVPAASAARDTVALEPGRTLTEVAQATGVPLASLLRLNPQLVASRAPPPDPQLASAPAARQRGGAERSPRSADAWPRGGGRAGRDHRSERAGRSGGGGGSGRRSAESRRSRCCASGRRARAELSLHHAARCLLRGGRPRVGGSAGGEVPRDRNGALALERPRP